MMIIYEKTQKGRLVDELSYGSGEMVLKRCDVCGVLRWIMYKQIIKSRKKSNGVDYCHDCSCRFVVAEANKNRPPEYWIPIIQKREETTMELYGAKNAFECEIFKEKIRETNLERYGDECAVRSEIVTDKYRGENHPNWNPLRHTEDFQNLRYNCNREMERNYKKFKDVINPDDLPRGNKKGFFSVDHRFSFYEAFLVGIRDVRVISHPKNLEMLLHSDNAKKSSNCSITLTELLSFSNIPIDSPLSGDVNAYSIFNKDS